jgi:hypothetical protein
MRLNATATAAFTGCAFVNNTAAAAQPALLSLAQNAAVVADAGTADGGDMGRVAQVTVANASATATIDGAPAQVYDEATGAVAPSAPPASRTVFLSASDAWFAGIRQVHLLQRLTVQRAAMCWCQV